MTDETKQQQPCECQTCLTKAGGQSTECADCHARASEDDMRECRECLKTICGDCTDECGECGAALCADCATTCATCDKTVCGQCLSECSDCQRRICCDCRSACDGCEYPLCRYCGRYCDHCDRLICDECTLWCECDHGWCSDECRDSCARCGDMREPGYRLPYIGTPAVFHETFSVGLEIEIDGVHDREHMTSSPLIAGWCPDGSLTEDGREYQTQPLTMRDLDALVALVEGIAEPPSWSHAGGHMHIRRTDKQTPSRWYWALKGLTDDECDRLNMRHQNDCQWCHLNHGDYSGKAAAVNDDHWQTIELRTFGAWHKGTAHKLAPAIRWAHTMWRLFQHHPVRSLKQTDIMACSRTAWHAAMPAMRKENR